jgi:D-lyxose ketol-isomerase
MAETDAESIQLAIRCGIGRMAEMKRIDVQRFQAAAKRRLQEAGVPLTDGADIEIADFGLGEYEKTGLALVLRCNEPEYCSKWLVVEPGQTCPAHHHKKKKETFFVHAGTVRLRAGPETMTLRPGDSFTIPRGVVHEFTSPVGAVVEEVSTHDENSDSYFVDPRIVRDPVIEE